MRSSLWQVGGSGNLRGYASAASTCLRRSSSSCFANTLAMLARAGARRIGSRHALFSASCSQERQTAGGPQQKRRALASCCLAMIFMWLGIARQACGKQRPRCRRRRRSTRVWLVQWRKRARPRSRPICALRHDPTIDTAKNTIAVTYHRAMGGQRQTLSRICKGILRAALAAPGMQITLLLVIERRGVRARRCPC